MNAQTKSVSVSFRVSPKFKRCLELAAAYEQRSQTNVLEKLLFDFCRKHGLDGEAKSEAGRKRED